MDQSTHSLHSNLIRVGASSNELDWWRHRAALSGPIHLAGPFFRGSALDKTLQHTVGTLGVGRKLVLGH